MKEGTEKRKKNKQKEKLIYDIPTSENSQQKKCIKNSFRMVKNQKLFRFAYREYDRICVL